MEHVRFHYHSIEEIQTEAARLGVCIPMSENVEVLRAPLMIGKKMIPNRLAIQPMEGADSTPDGFFSEHMERRYDRFASSGAGLIWWEASAITPEARATPGQLNINENTLDDFKRMIERVRTTAWKQRQIEPVIILQATHSGRYSKPNGVPEPIIAYHNPLFEKNKPIDDSRIISDDRLKELEELYGKVTVLAQKAGFDGIDVKACHRYINSELLSAYERPGEYGGSFENRTRFYRNAFRNAKAAASDGFIVTSRFNAYDGFPYPYGWGVAPDGGTAPDMTEPIRLMGMLKELGMELLNITCGNPYVNPHVNRPYDQGGYVPPEHPLEGEARMYDCIGAIAKAHPDLKIIASAPTYLRQFSANLAAGLVEQKVSSMVGFGRMAFAYPDFAYDMLHEGLDPKKVCLTCGKCAELLRDCTPAGCVIRDPKYTKIYRDHFTK